MISSQDLIRAEAEKLINSSKNQLGDLKKVALDQAWKMLQLAVASLVQIIEGIAQELSGPEKKALALELLNKFYDRVFLVVDIPLIPSLFESIIHKYVKGILMIMVSASVDATVTIFRNTGVFIKKEVNL